MIVEIYDIVDKHPRTLFQGDLTHLPRIGEHVYTPLEPYRRRCVEDIDHLISKNEVVILVR